MIDVKKLVTGFLVLAIAASGAALLISATGAEFSINSNSGGESNNLAVIGQGSVGGVPNDNNAFLPQQSPPTTDDTGSVTTADQSLIASTDPTVVSSTYAAMNQPGNMTMALEQAYFNNLASVNPNGPQDDGTGNMTLAPPDPSSVITQFAASSTPTSIPIPNWDTEAAEVPIVVVSSSPSAIANYGEAISNILGQDIVQSDLQNMLGSNADLNTVSFAAGKVKTALQDISSLKTPEPAVAFQKSLVASLVYAKNMLALGDTISSDPVKSEVIIEAEQSKYDAATQALQNQIQQLQSKNLFPSGTSNSTDGNENIALTTLRNLFGIPTAHAIFGLGDIVVDPAAEAGVWATVSHLIYAELKDVALQLAKNMIVFAMQHFILSNIGKSGAPGFIQQWGDTFTNTLTQAAVGALDSQMSCVGAAPFATQIRLALGATYKPGNRNVCSVQFQSQLGNNLSSFYNDFSEGGGWLTYGATLQPDNNYYGSLFFTAQAVGDTAQNAQSAAQTKAIANQGFHGTAVCGDGSNPNKSQTVCVGTITGGFAGSPPCPNGYTPETIPSSGLCADGTEPEVKTPGAVFNNMISSALDGNFKLITSANNWAGLGTGLLIGVLQQTLNSLADYSISSVNQALQSASQNGGGTVTSGGAYVPPQASQFLECDVSPPSPYGGNVGTQFVFTAAGGQSVVTGQSPTFSTPDYQWTAPDGTIVAQGVDNIQQTFDATGTYTYVLTDINPEDIANGQQPSTSCSAIVQ